MSKDFERPIIIIGAARSGTKMLRAALSATPELVAFPYDINYIWKYNNYHIPHDELTKEDLTNEINQFIRNQFKKLLLKNNAKRVLEKTVCNSLRVDFVKAIFPHCQIIHIYRDGRDVAADARLCWQSSILSSKIQSKRDLFKKIINFPLKAAWPYLVNYLSNNIGHFFSKTKYVKSWGPRFRDIDECLKKYSLIEVCGIQWIKSVEFSLKSFSFLEENKEYINIRYEDLVRNPVRVLRKIADFLAIENFGPIQRFAEEKITDEFVGFWQKALSAEEIEKLLPHIRKYLEILGYV